MRKTLLSTLFAVALVVSAASAQHIGRPIEPHQPEDPHPIIEGHYVYSSWGQFTQDIYGYMARNIYFENGTIDVHNGEGIQCGAAASGPPSPMAYDSNYGVSCDHWTYHMHGRIGTAESPYDHAFYLLH